MDPLEPPDDDIDQFICFICLHIMENDLVEYWKVLEFVDSATAMLLWLGMLEILDWFERMGSVKLLCTLVPGRHRVFGPVFSPTLIPHTLMSVGAIPPSLMWCWRDGRYFSFLPIQRSAVDFNRSRGVDTSHGYSLLPVNYSHLLTRRATNQQRLVVVVETDDCLWLISLYSRHNGVYISSRKILMNLRISYD
jgi:hypothetical protein